MVLAVIGGGALAAAVAIELATGDPAGAGWVHARARRVLVALAQPNGQLAVEVRDDGCGFDQATVGGLGLASLADRIAIVNGTLHIDSTPGQGTTLRAEVPLTVAGAGDG